MVYNFNVHAEMMKKIESWDRCKNCDKGKGRLEGEGRAGILSEIYIKYYGDKNHCR